LPDDSEEKWEYKEHTHVKHVILDKYLSAWVNILGAYNRNLNIFDCFAGRGEYADGSKGSPLIIIEVLNRIRRNRFNARCVFIERNLANFQNMQSVIEKDMKENPKKYGPWLRIDYHNDEFKNIAKMKLEDPTWQIYPSFFFLDPFGFSGIPFDLVKHILSIKRTEAFISFMGPNINRFMKSPYHESSIEELYGMSNVMGELATNYSSLPREAAALKLYRDRLSKGANVKFTFPFKVNADERLQTTYYLIHCTNHPKGCEIMKEIMYNVGTPGRFGYLGPAEGQMNLDSFTSIEKLKKFLLKRFKGQRLPYKEVRYQTLMDILFRKADYANTLNQNAERRWN
jgi:three-Cys-motif partner protein